MSKFSKRHHEAIANVLYRARYMQRGMSHTWGGINAVEALLFDLFEADNPRFSVEKFLAISQR